MADETATLLDACRRALRISSHIYDDEIALLAEAARAMLLGYGVDKDTVTDDRNPLVRLAIVVYVKANFGLDNPDTDKYLGVYEILATQLRLTNGVRP